MQRSYFIVSIFIITGLMAGCASKAPIRPEEVKALENPTPTNLPEQPIALDIPTLEIVPHDPPASCPITIPQNPSFVPPAPYDSLGFEGEFWYGSDSLWTAVRRDGIWEALPHNSEGYTQKVFWWRDGYVWTEEPEPALSLTAERLDKLAPVLQSSEATNAYAADIGSAMLAGVALPSLGCWKITGKYGNEELSFVVWVAP